MTKPEAASADKLTTALTQADWDEVRDSPELTADEIRSARSLQEAMPELADAIRRGRGPQRAATKRLISLRLDPRVIDHFKATGPGWQARINEVLAKVAGVR